jgi:hypothetical protein
VYNIYINLTVIGGIVGYIGNEVVAKRRMPHEVIDGGVRWIGAFFDHETSNIWKTPKETLPVTYRTKYDD